MLHQRQYKNRKEFDSTPNPRLPASEREYLN